MNQDTAICVDGVGKTYYLYNRPQDRLKEFFTRRFGKIYGHEFQALHDISFSVQKGESVGIIGRNGSGKSTLLQIIAGTLQPTAGRVSVQGRLAALLELGSGFKPEFTGRENSYMNATLLGLSKKETDERFEEIAAFADIGEFIDQPVKTYSSGMLIRVAFAVQVAVEPEVLIIDEALSVGDIFFQQKCMQRMRALQDNGTTLLFVSHDTSSIRDLCTRVVYLRQGKAAFIGECRQGIVHYYREMNEPESHHQAPPQTASLPSAQDTVLLEKFAKKAYWISEMEKHGEQPLHDFSILGVALLDEHRQPTTSVRMTDLLYFQILLKANISIEASVSLSLQNRLGHAVTTVGTFSSRADTPLFEQGKYYTCDFAVQMMFESGQYTFRVSAARLGGKPNYAKAGVATPWLGPFTVTWDFEKEWAPFLGMFYPPVEFRHLGVEEDSEYL